jgi:hypothetical protein
MNEQKLNDPEIRKTLETLKQELESTQPTDENEKTTISHLMEDIQEVIDHIDKDAPLLRQTNKGLSDRLRKSEVTFEISYPRLAAIIEKTIAVLDNAGI